jgi:hypothetical protein
VFLKINFAILGYKRPGIAPFLLNSIHEELIIYPILNILMDDLGLKSSMRKKTNRENA